jgi:xanthine dehydrogenase YagT iron-sulfur-binding subunit
MSMDSDGEFQDDGGTPAEGISRRDFLKLTGVALPAGGLIAQQAVAGAEASALVVGPAAIPITLQINGRPRRVAVEPRETLLDTLREGLGLTGAKRVCDRGTCGACTVLADGLAIYACSMLAVEAQGKRIVTIEGIAPEGALHPVSAAFVAHDAQQCGFCTPGMVMATKAFIDKHPNATEEELAKGLGGNLCRCGTYVGIRKVALEVARQSKGGG